MKEREKDQENRKEKKTRLHLNKKPLKMTHLISGKTE
jgi:hypothetical protein